MAYFNHAFSKCFVGTAGFTSLAGGQLGTTGNILATGEFGFVDPNTWELQTAAPTDCCPLILAAGSLYSNDKNGPFHGGYQESNKSKMINPKYVNRFYKVNACEAQAAVINVGSTPFTAGGGIDFAGISVTTPGTGYGDADGTYAVAVTGGSGTGAVLEVLITSGTLAIVGVINPGINYQATDTTLGVTGLIGGGTDVVFDVTAILTGAGGANCCCEFLCDETYNLRVDVKGSPALRFLNHQAYKTLDAYTGCCPDGAVAPTPVDATEVFILWATQIVEDPIMSQFVYPVVYDQTGTAWYAPGTDAAFLASVGADTWDNYTSPGYIMGACAGFALTAAYIDTRFGDCTFQPSDFHELEPLRLYASEVDLNGDPCEFAGCCVIDECLGLQSMGDGEGVVRDVIMSEEYRQNFFHSDLRIREITQGDQILNAIDRTQFYDRYYILHSVPRFNNPTGTFDNDQYLLDIIVPQGSDNSAFEAFMDTWLADCSQCTGLEEISCLSDCTSLTPIPPVV
jgi:hypothetical protein